MAVLRRLGRSAPSRGPLTAVRTAPSASRGTPERTIWDDTSAATAEWASTSAPLEGTTTADVCVIGLGITGLSAAAALAAAGADVVGVNAGPIGSGNSSRTTGLAGPGLTIPYHQLVALLGRRRAAALYRATLNTLDAMAAFPREFQHTGVVRETGTDGDMAAQEIAALTRDGFNAEAAPTGVYVPFGGVVDPLQRLHRVAEAAQQAGARLISDTQAQQVAERGTFGATGEVQCRVTIIALDGGLDVAVPALAHDVRTRTMRAAATASSTVETDHPVMSGQGTSHWLQLPAGHLVAQHGPARTKPKETALSSGTLDARLTDTLAAVDATAAITHRWSIASGFTTDGLPRIARMGATIAVGGYNGASSVLGPLLGQAAAELALGRRSKIARILNR